MIWDYENLLTRRLLLWAWLGMLAGAGLLLFGDSLWPLLGLQALAWGATEALIAAFGLRRAKSHLGQPSSRGTEEEEAARLRKILWINNALAILFVGGGAAAVTFSGSQLFFWRGVGWGVILQAGFLFGFTLWHARRVPDPLALPHLPLFTHPDHNPFLFEGGQPAAFLIHGFPGTALEMRSVGQALNTAGWTVRGVRLPGFGPELEDLIDFDCHRWVEALDAEFEALKAQGYGPLIVVGFSFGGGLALQLAARHAPDGLILLAPMTWQEAPWTTVVLNYARSLLPHHVAPLRYIPVTHPAVKEEFWQYLPELDLSDPAQISEAQRLQVPLYILDQLREVGREALKAAPQVTAPTLIIQGSRDPFVRPGRTDSLRKRMRVPLSYEVVDGPHNLTMSQNPAFEAVLVKITDFAARILQAEKQN